VFNRYDPFFTRYSIYFHYGYFPYIAYSRIHTRPYVILAYYSSPLVLYNDGYYYSGYRYDGLNETISDIRYAWLNGRLDLIKDHVDIGGSIDVLRDGRYDYTVNSDDYLDMTADAMGETDTISFTWERVRRSYNDDFTAYGRHEFRDIDGDRRVVYVSYTLERIGGDYVITEVGTSKSRRY